MGTLKTLSAFDFSLQPSLDRNHALALAQLDIIDSLAKVDREGRLRERIGYLCRASLLIIDAWAAKQIKGYLTVGAGAGNLFFPLVNARYEEGAMFLTSARDFAE